MSTHTELDLKADHMEGANSGSSKLKYYEKYYERRRKGLKSRVKPDEAINSGSPKLKFYERRRKGLKSRVKPDEAINSGNEGQGSVHQVSDLPEKNSMMECASGTGQVVLALMAPSQVSSSPQPNPKGSKGRVNPTKASKSGDEGQGPVDQVADLPGEKSMMESAPRTGREVVVGLMVQSQVSSASQPKRKQSKGRVNSMKASNSAREQSRRSQQIKSRKRVAIDSDDEKTTASVTHVRRQLRRRAINGRHEGQLDDEGLNKYLGKLWQTIPSEKKDSHDYIDCLWFKMYCEGDKEKTLGWIKRYRKFTKKYVFAPICLHNHWSLLIFCHMGDDLQSKATTPCVLLLDSLQKANQKKEVDEILRKFLLDVFQGKGITVSNKEIKKIPLLVPKVPQQTGNKECGYYVLYYITKFLMSSPETFSISDGYPYFMSRGWFTAEEVESFRKTLPQPGQETGS